MTDPATILEEAADLLLVHGRCKWRAMDDDGTFCVVGAVMAAQGVRMRPGLVMAQPGATEIGAGYFDPALVPLAKAVGTVGPHVPPGAVVANWNDNTADDFEVIDTLRHVAKDLRNGELG